jgi:hypothetical protein
MLTMNAPWLAARWRTLAARVGGLVLPLKARVGIALFEALVVLQCGQAARQRGQRARHQRGMGLDAKQVLVQGLIENRPLPGVPIAQIAIIFDGIGAQRIAFVEIGLAARLVRDAGVVVVGQHQAQARDVHGERVVQRKTTRLNRHLQQLARIASSLLAPRRLRHRQAMRKRPMRAHRGGIGGFARFIPVGADSPQQPLKVGRIHKARMRAKAAPAILRLVDVLIAAALLLLHRHAGQAVVGQHQPGHGLRQWRQGGEWQMALGLRLVQPIAQQSPALMIEPLRLERLGIQAFVGQPLQPACIVIATDERLKQPHRHPFMPVVVALGAAIGRWSVGSAAASWKAWVALPRSCSRAASAASAVMQRQVVPGASRTRCCAARCGRWCWWARHPGC